MGRPEVTIPENRPMKAMAEQLRRLRRASGSPSYRLLGELVHVEQQSLSQTANGNRVGWGRVLLYVQALREHNPRAVTVTDLATLKHLHDLGERQYRETAMRHMRRRQSTGTLWSEIDSTAGMTAYTTARHRPPGQWELTPGVTDSYHLGALRTIDGLFSLLNQVAGRHGIDLAHPYRSHPRPAGFSWFGEDTKPERPIPQLMLPRELTTTSLAAAVRACGGTEGDCVAWLAAWERIHRAQKDDGDTAHPRFLPPAEPPPATRAGAHRSGANQMISDAWPGRLLRRPATLRT
uniref:hypothetical protein n=1 Tax=Actinoplanes sp. CA-151224 TaxID=3239904 RepID=UPI003F496966